MFEATIRGMIGGTTESTLHMMPTKEPTVRETAGGGTQVSNFIRFKMFVKDLTKRKQPGKDGEGLYYPTMVVQVIIPDTPYGQTMWNDVQAGRYVTVVGLFYQEKNTETDKNTGQLTHYANLIVRARRIEFNDQPPIRACEKILGQLVDECGALEKETADKLNLAYKEYAATLKRDLPGKIELDVDGNPIKQQAKGEEGEAGDLTDMEDKTLE